MMNRKVFGKIGEKIASKYLQKQGYEIICMNYYTKRGEIDIIAKKQNILSFVEVKTRSNFNYGTPREAVNFLKIKHIKTAARIFLLLNKNFINYEINFDVIEVIFRNGKYEVNHIKHII
jgi:putative endonuclease